MTAKGITGRFADHLLSYASRGLAAAVVVVALAAPAAAENICTQWKFDGKILLKQSNNEYGVGIDIRQSGSQFSGTGHYGYTHGSSPGLGFLPKSDEFRLADGVVGGTVAGSNFEATIRWSNASIGIYTGQISPQGILSGHTYDQTDSGAQAEFYAAAPLECMSYAASSPGPVGAPSKPPLALGRVQTGASGSTHMDLCAAAMAARGRNSPAAPSLERRCQEQKDALRASTLAVPRGHQVRQLMADDSTASVSPQPLAQAGIDATPPDQSTASICAPVKSAHSRHSPSARNTERRCQEMMAVGQTAPASTTRGWAGKGLSASEATGEIPAALRPGGGAAMQGTFTQGQRKNMYRPKRRGIDPAMEPQMQSSMQAVRRRQDAVQLNPQPLPPQAPGTITDAAQPR